MRKTDRMIQIILNIFFIIMCLLIIIPFVMLISVSFSNEKDIASYGYSILPKQVDLSAYRYIFKNPQPILNAYKVTAIFSVIGTFVSVLFMAMVAYPLSKRGMRGKKGISLFMYFTMLFSGGLVPIYILITRYLHLDDTIWVYILPGMISPWYVFMMRAFFQDIPIEISESMLVDGADEYTIFFRMIIPLSKPVLATVSLFVFLGKWNDWYTAMLYINDDKLISLQYLLQRIMQNIQLLQNNSIMSDSMLSAGDIPSETVRMAMAIVVAGPALVIFPFFQKYFAKGLTVGSVKG